MKGFKVFNPDWKCRGFQFEVGKTYEENVDPKCCDRGFHFCTKASDCFKYYDFDSKNKVAEVEALGEIDTESDDSKCCTNKIHIVRELTWHEVLDLVNLGKDCTGFYNTGNRNTGNCNTGNRNTGNCNTGDWNFTNHSAGCFNTEEQNMTMFDEPSDWTYSNWINSDARHLLNQIPKNVVEWIWSSNMTDEEKDAHPEHETTGGYLKVLDERDSGQLWWDGLPKTEKNIILNLPNFDVDKFFETTGIKVGDQL